MRRRCDTLSLMPYARCHAAAYDAIRYFFAASPLRADDYASRFFFLPYFDAAFSRRRRFAAYAFADIN